MKVSVRFREWVRGNKVAALVIFILLLLALKPLDLIANLQGGKSTLLPYGGSSYEGVTPDLYREPPSPIPPLPGEDISTSKERLVLEETTLSLVVRDVRKAADSAIDYAKGIGGFMVSSSITRPEESPVATVVVRVPSEKFKEAVEYFRSSALKVSSEYLLGEDVTAEYEDLDKKIVAYEKTMARFEEIRGKATKIEDLLAVTREIISLQDQIDDLKGRKEFLEKSAAFAKVTLYLATDEFELPYQPPEGFRPGVVFKLAVRSLLGNLYAVARGLIWIGVYSAVWLPVLALSFYLYRRFFTSKHRR